MYPRAARCGMWQALKAAKQGDCSDILSMSDLSAVYSKMPARWLKAEEQRAVSLQCFRDWIMKISSHMTKDFLVTVFGKLERLPLVSWGRSLLCDPSSGTITLVGYAMPVQANIPAVWD